MQRYSPANIVFRLLDVTYSVNDSWATDAASKDMKSALRRGTYADLNIYYQTNLSSPAYTGSVMLLGYCTLPATWIQASSPPSYYQQDGCNVLAGSMPGGNVRGYNQGLTSVHEVGHWFGLLHTFQDYTCDPADQGDMIADTPQQSTATNGCPVAKDSCPGDPGLDAVHNYMDYSTDSWWVSLFPFSSSSFSSSHGARCRRGGVFLGDDESG